MKNKSVGYLIIGIAVLMIAIVLIFNFGLRDIVSQTCTHGPECSMYDTIEIQTYFSLAIAGIVVVIGLFLIFSKPDEKIITKLIKEKKKKLNLEGLEKEEKDIVQYIIEEGGAVFQSTLMEKFDIGKVKTTRVLDKLEAKQLIERKRRGMNNIVVLKTS